MEYCLEESNAYRYVSLGVNVFGIDPKGEPMAIAKECIERMREFMSVTLNLPDSFTKVGIKREDFAVMARKACRYGAIRGFKTLEPEDVERIFEMCI